MAKYTVSRTDGTPIPDDEPCFIIRAQDVLAQAIVRDYLDHAIELRLPDDFRREIMAHLNRIADWQDNNRDKVKIPD